MNMGDRERLRELVDRQQIEEVMSRYAHGVDRHDVDLMAQVYHPDATDWHGPFRGDVPAFLGWVNNLHEGKTRAHTHNITTHWSEIGSDSAWAETYVLFALFLRDRDIVMLGSGRYIDRLDRRAGVWKIAERSTVTDVRIEADGSCFHLAPGGYKAGTWDRDDLSYQRPLRIPGLRLASASLSTDIDADAMSLDGQWNRRAIRDCIVQALRGMDRNDRNLALGSFHANAQVEDGAAGVGAVDWVDIRLEDFAQQDAAVSHNLATQLLTIDGDQAKAESYLIVMRRRLDGANAWVGSVRLLDDLAYRDGRWAITNRQVVGDWEFAADGSLFNNDDSYLHGRRDRQDPWYRRTELGKMT